MEPTKQYGIGSNVRLLLGCLLAFAAALFVTSSLLSEQPSSTTSGFDFSPVLKLEAETQTGLKVGERIELARLTGRDGVTLAGVMGAQPVMLAIITPDCGMCTVAADEMKYIREQLATKDIEYHITSFTFPDADLVFRYVDSIAVGAQAFIWKSEQGPPPNEYLTMVVPYHVLVDHTGTIIDKWPGSHAQSTVRKRMGDQIVADTLKIVFHQSQTITSRL
jgi:hypothetical protein